MAAQDQNKVCPKCFEVNDPAATFCIECGAPLSDDPASEGSDQEVYREITQANLNRIRGDYKKAVEICLAILKRFPNNGTAHTLLGDIYAEQGELEQAEQWFEMALDLRPESENDRRKLEAVKRRRSEQDAASTAQQLGIPESRPRTQQYAFVMVVLVVIVGLGAFMLGSAIGKRQAPEKPTVLSDPIIVGQPEPTPEQPPQDDTTASQPVRTEWPGTPADQVVAARLAGIYTVARKLTSALDDPRGPRLVLTAALQDDDDPVRVVTDFAKAVFKEYPGYSVLSVRLTKNGPVVYAADVRLSDFQRVNAEGLEDAEMVTNVWPAPAPPQDPPETDGA